MESQAIGIASMIHNFKYTVAAESPRFIQARQPHTWCVGVCNAAHMAHGTRYHQFLRWINLSVPFDKWIDAVSSRTHPRRDHHLSAIYRFRWPRCPRSTFNDGHEQINKTWRRITEVLLCKFSHVSSTAEAAYSEATEAWKCYEINSTG